jgi:hypothetical protein
VLAIIAAVIVVAFNASEIAMLPLYALGVMLGFTLSQAGMVRLFGKIMNLKPGETAKTGVTTIHYERTAKWKRLLPAFGAAVTGMVLVVLIFTKFMEGAWVVVVAIPLIVWGFRSIRRHYDTVAEALSLREFDPAQMHDIADIVIIPMGDIHRGTLRAIRYVKQLSHHVQAVSIITNEAMHERVQRRWERFAAVTEGVQLKTIDYEYRDILTPLVDYVSQMSNEQFPGQLITVVVPEFVPDTVWGNLLHNQTANILRVRLRQCEDVVVIDLPFHIHNNSQKSPEKTVD